MIDFTVVLFGSFLIVYYSRQSILKPCSHGFFRFFAWEITLIQFVFNRIGWFSNAFFWYQAISWFLLTISIFLVIEGTCFLRKYGKSVTSFEATRQLVTKGIYQYIRHPMYASLLFLAWGIFFKSPSWLDFVLTMTSSIFLYATAHADEKKCIAKFGDEYEIYMRTSKRFIPYLF
ncbi:MAG: hypothetical protein A2X25_03195 [Chloroflexi bacterium GWB2_49_20]|nr:MAG: hypothetical protein A2X25_03195 [Chloroflexi bacterium GWB2_49_20]OGN76104.1 MAG: hypothetical protein A2X26_11470 [Chloroflexi bacterium GWC2_49_37]OGN83490.1 MAG: hypothetical protein A2X27_09305 [Chloroflexi bacterium GWD2_49_16]HBG73890.1 isoprenylcysteine carboxyl methyltransferase [Anaerolineae bacterium]HCC79531.1 isoprenylcysteine carboxyl methyltransferase [Anaerolineae bacterium]